MFVGDSGVDAEDVDGAEMGNCLLNRVGNGGFAGNVSLEVEDGGRESLGFFFFCFFFWRRRRRRAEVVSCYFAAGGWMVWIDR